LLKNQCRLGARDARDATASADKTLFFGQNWVDLGKFDWIWVKFGKI